MSPWKTGSVPWLEGGGGGGRASGCDGKWSPGNEKSRQGVSSGGRESPRFDGEMKSSQEVSRLVETGEQGGGEGSARGNAVASPGGIVERSEERHTEVSITESAEDEKYSERAASCRDSGDSSCWISAVVLLHTSQEGSGHNM